MRENRDRAPGSAPSHVTFEREPVEVEADLRRHVRAIAADDRDAVRVLDVAHVVARLVAADRDVLVRDSRRLLGEPLDRRELGVAVERAPPRSALDDPRDSGQHSEDAEPDQEAPER